MRIYLSTVIMFIVLSLNTDDVVAFGGNSLPASLPALKALPKSKALPATKALPSTQSLPSLKSVTKAKKLPSLKALPKPKKLVLKPVFGPRVSTSESEAEFDPRYDPPPFQSTGEQQQLILQEGVLNLTLDEKHRGDVRIVTDENMDRLFLSKDTILSMLDGYLMPDIHQQIKLHLFGRQWLDEKEIIDMGFGFDFDKKNLVVNINVPANYRKIKTKQLGGTVVDAQTIDVHPAKRSASITPYWSRIWRDKISVTNAVNFDAAINFDGWVLESDTAYDVLRSFNRRKTTRLVRDYPSQVTRVSAGDVEYKTIGLMGRKALGGMSISREFSLKPNLLTTPVSRQRIFLKNDATLRVFINDIPRQSFSLSAGYYDLQDFPFIDGLNFVKLEITDVYGQVEIFEYVGFDNKKVLVPGITDYSLTAGFDRLVDETASTQYDFSSQAFSGYYRKGINKNYTLGALTEGDNGFVSIGGYGVATGLFGTIEASSLLSANLDGSRRVGLGLSMNYYFATSRFTIANTAFFKTKRFSFLGKNNYSQLQKYFVSSSLGLPLPYFKRWRQNFSVRYENRWNDAKQARVSYKLNGRVSKNYTLATSAFYSVNENGIGHEQGVTLSLRWYPSKRMTVSSTYDSQIQGQQLDVSRGPVGAQGVGMNASLSNNENAARVSGGLTWKTQYFNSRYNGSVAKDKPLTEKRRQYETFSLTSSFVYVDGAIAMGPPIKNGSFVIFKAGEGLGRGRIAVGKTSVNNDRESMPFLAGKESTALFTGLNLYSTSTAYMQPYLEDGFIGLDKRKYRIFSSFRSGALVTVSKHVRMYGAGVLANREWEPIALMKGTFIHEKSKEEMRFFTDDEGYFEIENLLPGKHLIVLDGYAGVGDVTVEVTADNFIDFGILSLKGAQ